MYTIHHTTSTEIWSVDPAHVPVLTQGGSYDIPAYSDSAFATYLQLCKLDMEERESTVIKTGTVSMADNGFPSSCDTVLKDVLDRDPSLLQAMFTIAQWCGNSVVASTVSAMVALVASSKPLSVLRKVFGAKPDKMLERQFGNT